MTENWDSYFCTVEDRPASIVVNLALAVAAPVPGFSALGYASVFLQKPDASGFPDLEEEKTLAELEDTLVENLESKHKALCAGHCLTNGRLDIYFYLSAPEGFSQAVTHVLDAFSSHAWEAGTHADPDWELYFGFLFPDEQTMLRIQNRRVYDKLQELGDDLSLERLIEHWADFPSGESAEAFGNSIEALGHRILAIAPLENQDSYGGEGADFRQIHFTKPDIPAAMDDHTLVLAELAKAHGGAYRGWTCMAVEANPDTG